MISLIIVLCQIFNCDTLDNTYSESNVQWDIVLQARKNKSDTTSAMQFATLFSNQRGLLLCGGGSDLHQRTARPTLYRSLDDGFTWAPVFVGKSNQFSLYSFQQLPDDTLVGIVPDSLLFSFDNGGTWEERKFKGTGFSMCQGNGVLIVSKNPNHIYRSTDNGRTFLEVKYSSEIGCDNLRAMSFKDGVFYMGVGDETNKDSHARVFKSTDLGLTWTKVFDKTSKSEEGFVVFSVLAMSANEILIGTGGASTGNAIIYRSSDGGRSWRPVLDSRSIHRSITIVRSFYDDVKTGRIYCCLDCSYASSKVWADEPDVNTNSAIIVSEDRGLTWSLFSRTGTKRLYWLTRTQDDHLLCSTGEYGVILRSKDKAPN